MFSLSVCFYAAYIATHYCTVNKKRYKKAKLMIAVVVYLYIKSAWKRRHPMKYKLYHIRLDEDQVAILEAAAKLKGLKIGPYMRMVALEKAIADGE